MIDTTATRFIVKVSDLGYLSRNEGVTNDLLEAKLFKYPPKDTSPDNILTMSVTFKQQPYRVKQNEY